MNALASAEVSKASLFIQLTTALEGAGIDYVVVGRVTDFPEHIDSDVDFVVRTSDFFRLPGLIADLAHRVSGRLVQYLRHEVEAGYFVVAVQVGCEVLYIHPDASADYRRGGKLWMSASELIDSRRRHPAGFWLPGIAEGFVYYLVKRVDKAHVDQVHLDYLRSQYQADPAACDAALNRRFGPALSLRLREALEADNAQLAMAGLRALRGPLHANAPSETFHNRVHSTLRDIYRRLLRTIEPTGLSVGFLGPDGSGKSTLIDRCIHSIAPAFRRHAYFHLRPRRLFARGSAVGGPANTDPHGSPPRSALASVAKLSVLLTDYTLGYLLAVWPLLRRSTLVIFDRYLQDMQADPYRYRWGGPRNLPRAVSRWVPQPDLWVVLDAPEEVLLARKAEVTREAAASQRLAYRALADELPRCILVDTSQSVDRCVAEVNRHILKHLEQRTLARLGLDGSRT